MKKFLIILTTAAVLLCSAGCSAVKRTNAPDAERKSDTATPKANKEQAPVIEMEE